MKNEESILFHLFVNEAKKCKHQTTQKTKQHVNEIIHEVNKFGFLSTERGQ